MFYSVFANIKIFFPIKEYNQTVYLKIMIIKIQKTSLKKEIEFCHIPKFTYPYIALQLEGVMYTFDIFKNRLFDLTEFIVWDI